MKLLSPAEKTARYRAWLARENTRPLTGLLWEPDIPPLPALLEKVGLGNPLRPADVEPELFLPFVEQCFQLDQSFPGDVIQPFSPAFGIPWMEAIAGCTPVCEAGSIWAHPCLESYLRRPRLAFDPGNAWFQALAGFTRALVRWADGRFPVALPQMRGPLDLLAAMRKPEEMCLDLLEQPEEVHAILRELTGLWTGVARELLALIPPYQGGYCSRMKMWAPGQTITPQNDTSALVSPTTYETFLGHSDRAIQAAFPYSCFHMHSTEYRHVETLLRMPDLTCIEFTLEHPWGGLALEPSLAIARRILAHKPLVLAAPDVPSAEICRAALPAEGLCLLLAANEPEPPIEFISWIAEAAS